MNLSKAGLLENADDGGNYINNAQSKFGTDLTGDTENISKKAKKKKKKKAKKTGQGSQLEEEKKLQDQLKDLEDKLDVSQKDIKNDDSDSEPEFTVIGVNKNKKKEPKRTTPPDQEKPNFFGL